MPLVDGRSIALPYGIETCGRHVRVFNREYGVLAKFDLRRSPADSTLAAMSHDGEVRAVDGAATIFFYDDACIPFQEAVAATSAYVERLGRFARLKAARAATVVPGRHVELSG